MKKEIKPSVAKWIQAQIITYKYWIEAGPQGQGWQFSIAGEKQEYTEILEWLKGQSERKDSGEKPAMRDRMKITGNNRTTQDRVY